MPKIAPADFFSEASVAPDNIRYVVLKQQIGWTNFFSSQDNIGGYFLEGVNFYRSLNDARESLKNAAGVVLQFNVDDMDYVQVITHRYNVHNTVCNRDIISREKENDIIDVLNIEYQKFLVNNATCKIKHPDMTPEGEHYYQFARLSDSIGADYENFSLLSNHLDGDAAGVAYGIMFPLLIISAALKLAYLTQLSYHFCADTKLFGCSLDKKIEFDANNVYPGTWIKFEVKPDGQFLKLQAAYRVLSEGSFEELSNDLSTVSEEVVEKFKHQYESSLTEQKQQAIQMADQIQQEEARQKATLLHQEYRRAQKRERDRQALDNVAMPRMKR